MDNRNIKTGRIIPVSGYCDQPYVIKTDDGAWLLCVTTADAHEGAAGQHVITMRSFDCGESWCDLADVSPADAPESSYAVMYKTSYGRVYCFYNYNRDNFRELKADNPPFKDGLCKRVDTAGHFVFKFSDDNGKTWSPQSYDIPMRRFEVDRLNPYGGEIMFFWNVGKPLELNGGICVPIYKIRAFGNDFMRYSEGALLHCPNINSERDVTRLSWETLPDGDKGIRVPHELSIVSEEHSFVTLSDGTVFCTFRTTTGHPYCAYSYDGCRSFTEPEPMRFANGRPMKHPRAANMIWKCKNGKFIYWFHNNGGRGYEYRNPVWLSGGEEYLENGRLKLRFSQPLPVLYDDDSMIRMSYPDLIEDGGEYYLTETQKNVARVHHIDKRLIESLWTPQPLPEGCEITDELPKLPRFRVPDYSSQDAHGVSTESSLTLKFTCELKSSDEQLFSTMESGRGLELNWNAGKRRLELLCGDGQRLNLFIDDDPLLGEDGEHAITVVFDGGIRAVYFVTDGAFCDGGEQRIFGFTRFDRELEGLNGLKKPSVNKLRSLKLYDGIYLY